MQTTEYGTNMVLVAFYTGIISTFVAIFIIIGSVAGNGDNAASVASAIKWSYVVGAIMIALLLGIHILTYRYTNELIKTCMIYLTFIMAYMAMCISLINITHT
jgi:ABC-type spermidine/putrescine transport system permease subunit II